ncbi:hypothetical protein JAF95_002950 [Citrobacter braakii]|uniref:hypothetical protein n=1 Tax=unclassified Citrobacter TaxID=2644389 RepID=UPI0015E91C07|nr:MULTISPECIES: hypothetical protein [unclassified Citrobacter]EGT0649837.1 hypothetical protein [Citrobacter braakii]MBU5642278.1 hypothetical protein [Citrobacter sp. S46_ASV_140]QLY03060.1 hypothetical protein HV243_11495 [Citrobacter sp. RHBSTW-00599]
MKISAAAPPAKFTEFQKQGIEGEMRYFMAFHGEHQELIVIKAKSMFVAKALLNDDCDCLKRITAKEAKELLSRGFQLKK